MNTNKKKAKKWGGARVPAFKRSDVLRIRRMAKAGKKPSEIARTVGARLDTTIRVIKGYSYKDVEPKTHAKTAQITTA